MNIKHIDIEKVAQAIEADAGQSLAGLRESLAQAKRGEFGAVHTPEQLAARKPPSRQSGQATPKQRTTTLRLDEDALARWRASGKDWQARAAALLAKHAP